MTTLINARPRFGLEGDRLFCYLTSSYFPASGRLADGLGVWDLHKVAELIRGGSTIEAAFTLASNVSPEELLEIRSEIVNLAAKNQALVEENRGLSQKLVVAISEAQRLNDLINAGKSETASPAEKDKVEETVQAFNEATPPAAEGDKVEQAKQDFLTEPSGAFDVAAAAMAAKPEDYRRPDDEPKADIEGALEPQEAPPKGE